MQWIAVRKSNIAPYMTGSSGYSLRADTKNPSTNVSKLAISADTHTNECTVL